MQTPRRLEWTIAYLAGNARATIVCVLPEEEWNTGVLADRAAVVAKQQAVEHVAKRVVGGLPAGVSGGETFLYVFPRDAVTRIG